ncbi:hypothetical protein AMTRI_Chr09g39420 [Amborella trichopoda]
MGEELDICPRKLSFQEFLFYHEDRKTWNHYYQYHSIKESKPLQCGAVRMLRDKTSYTKCTEALRESSYDGPRMWKGSLIAISMLSYCGVQPINNVQNLPGKILEL